MKDVTMSLFWKLNMIKTYVTGHRAGSHHPEILRSTSTWAYGCIVFFFLIPTAFTANAAIDDPLTDYCDLRYFRCNNTGTNADYRLPGDVRVSADFYCGLMKEATYERPRDFNATKRLPLPDNFDQQILNENLGGSEWVVENTQSDPQDNSTYTKWIRKDD